MVNAFSFCLYGPNNPRYYVGLFENIFLAEKYFPTWKVYVYSSPDVEETTVTQLKACSNVELRETGVNGAPNMIHRFYAVDEDGVDVMMVRDADSRIHWKDRWAIRDFMSKPSFIAHTIRDNVQHTAYIMGGIWGLRKSAGLNMHNEYANYVEDTSRGWRVAHDQNFLADVIYPKVVTRMLVHVGGGLRKLGEHIVDFPFEWKNEVYCGRIEDKYIDYVEPPKKSILPIVYSQGRDDIVNPLLPKDDTPFLIRKPSTTPDIIKFLHRK